jgi:hypothetical protein
MPDKTWFPTGKTARCRSVQLWVIQRVKSLALTVAALTAAASIMGIGGCSASAPDATTPRMPTRSLGLALEAGPCVAGVNVVSATALASGPGDDSRYLVPADGSLRLALVLDGAPPRPVRLEWLDVPDVPAQPLPGPPWNLKLEFESPVAGECPIRVDFEPSPQAASRGLGPATTTVVLKDAPPPPSPQQRPR